jgi:hypothetical protein
VLSARTDPFYGPEHFTYQPESNSYRCSAGEQLNYVGLNVRNRAQAYIGSAKRCGACWQKKQNARVDGINILPFTWMSWPGNVPASWPHTRVLARTAAKKKSRSPVCGTQESDGSASLAPTQVEVRAGAVLLGSGCAEHQAPCAVPQPTDKPGSACYYFAERQENIRLSRARSRKDPLSNTFSTPKPDYNNYPDGPLALKMGQTFSLQKNDTGMTLAGLSSAKHFVRKLSNGGSYEVSLRVVARYLVIWVWRV